MQFKSRIAVTLIVLVVLVVTVLFVQYAYTNQKFSGSPITNYKLDETYTEQSFLYSSQAWMPGGSKLRSASQR